MTVSDETVKTTNTEDDEIVTSVTLVLPSCRSAAQFTSSSASVTMNVPSVMSSSTQQQSSSIATKKTDLDLISIKVSPTKHNTIANANAADDSNSGDGGGGGSDGQRIGTNTKDCCLYGMGITDDDKNGKAAIQKRSLLDMDNASSLSLADKLRNEANKYSGENAGREHFGPKTETMNVAACEQIDKKTGTATSPTSPNGLYQSCGVASSTSSIGNVSAGGAPATSSSITTSTTNCHANERRPSWRLKLDAGCKVKTILHKKIKKQSKQ